MAEMDADDRDKLRKDQFAYVDSKGGEHLPIHDESHVRNAMARFNQTKGVTDAERDQAFENIKAAAAHYKIEMTEKSWHDFGSGSS